MKTTDSRIETVETPDHLAKRIFVLALLGVIAYVGIVIALMTSLD